MSNKNYKNTSIPLSQVGNFTKNAVENFEESIVRERNYLEKVQNNLNNKS